MGKYLSTFDTLADYEAATSELGYPNVSLIKADGSILYAKNAPISSTCYEIIPESIESYTATTYDSVYSVTDAKWYMLNNLNEYEQYGVYDIVEDISNATTYEGKLAVVDTTEYQYSGGSWNDVGTYEESSVTYEIDYTQPSPYVGQELSTTFKIPYADVEAVGSFDLLIANNNSDELDIHLEARGGNYRYEGFDDYYQGTVTNDGEYFYLSLPSDAPQSIMIDSVGYWNSTPIHLIVGSKQASVEYAEKEAPSYSIYNTVQEMEAVGCPNVGVNEYAFVGNDLYKYFANEEWSEVEYSDPKMVAFYENETPLLVYGNGELTQGETKIRDISPKSVYIGDSVTSIGENAFHDNTYPNNNTITSVTFSDNSQLTSIERCAFQECSGLTSITIPSGVTSIGGSAFYSCISLTSINIPSGVTSISDYAFENCSGLTSINIPSGVTSIGVSAFNNTPWWNTYSADTSHHYGNIVYINDIAYVATSSGITSCTFKEGTVNICNYAFNKCSRLTSVNIPDSVTSIGNGAFQECSGLTSCTIGNSVTSIGVSAFENCSGLTSCTIGSGVTSIGYGAFYHCKSLTSIRVNATTPPTLGFSVFDNTSNCPIYVPSESVNAYKTAINWKDYASRIQAIP